MQELNLAEVEMVGGAVIVGPATIVGGFIGMAVGAVPGIVTGNPPLAVMGTAVGGAEGASLGSMFDNDHPLNGNKGPSAAALAMVDASNHSRKAP